MALNYLNDIGVKSLFHVLFVAMVSIPPCCFHFVFVTLRSDFPVQGKGLPDAF